MSSQTPTPSDAPKASSTFKLILASPGWALLTLLLADMAHIVGTSNDLDGAKGLNLFGSIVVLGLAFLSACQARLRGFIPAAWVLTAGVIGFIVLVNMPSATKDGLDAGERKRRARM